MRFAALLAFVCLSIATDFYENIRRIHLKGLTNTSDVMKHGKQMLFRTHHGPSVSISHKHKIKHKFKRNTLDDQFQTYMAQTWTNRNPIGNGDYASDVLRPDFGTLFKYKGRIHPTENAWTVTLRLNIPQMPYVDYQHASICDEEFSDDSCRPVSIHECQLHDHQGFPSSAYWEMSAEYIASLRQSVKHINESCGKQYIESKCDTVQIQCLTNSKYCSEHFSERYNSFCQTMIDTLCLKSLEFLKPLKADICRSITPMIATLRKLASNKRNILHQNVRDLKALWPEVQEFQTQDTHFPTNTETTFTHYNRTKRGLSTGLMWAGIIGGAFIGPMINGIRINNLHNSIVNVERYAHDTRKKMIALASSLQSFQHETLNIFKKIDSEMIGFKFQLTHIRNVLRYSNLANHMSDKYVLMILANMIYDIHFGYLRILEEFINSVKTMISAKAILQHKRLPVELFSVKEINHIIKHVKLNIKRTYPNYILAFDDHSILYIAQFATHFRNEDNFYVQLKLPIKSIKTYEMSLYSFKQVPVPFDTSNINDTKYTMINTKYSHIAISKSHYISMTDHDLGNCMQYNDLFYCAEHLVIEIQVDKLSCLSSLILGYDAKTVTSNCKFDVHMNFEIHPSILEHSNFLLLSNIDLPVSWDCLHDKMLQMTTIDNYVIINKTQICGCSIITPTIYIGRQLSLCNSTVYDTIDFHYTANFAVLQLLQEQFSEFPSNIFTKFQTAVLNNLIPDVKLYQTEEPDVLETDTTILDLHELSKAVDQYDVIFKELSDKESYLSNTQPWYSGSSKTLYIMTFVLIAIAVLAIIGICYLCLRHAAMATTLASALLPKPAACASNEDILSFLHQEFEHHNILLKALETAAVQVIFLLMLIFLYYFIKFLFNNFKLFRIIYPVQPFEENCPFKGVQLDLYVNISNGIQEILIYLTTIKTPVNNLNIRTIESVEIQSVEHHCGYTSIEINWNDSYVCLKRTNTMIDLPTTLTVLWPRTNKIKSFQTPNDMARVWRENPVYEPATPYQSPSHTQLTRPQSASSDPRHLTTHIDHDSIDTEVKYSSGSSHVTLPVTSVPVPGSSDNTKLYRWTYSVSLWSKHHDYLYKIA